MLQTVHAIYKNEKLIFADRTLIPENGSEVIITFIDKSPPETILKTDLVQELRGRGKGENLVQRLLQSRREERDRDEGNR